MHSPEEIKIPERAGANISPSERNLLSTNKKLRRVRGKFIAETLVLMDLAGALLLLCRQRYGGLRVTPPLHIYYGGLPIQG